MKSRTLKIELTGDFFSGKTHPKIRLCGKWLQAAGFPPGSRVEVTQTGAGRLELRVCDAVNLTANDPAFRTVIAGFERLGL